MCVCYNPQKNLRKEDTPLRAEKNWRKKNHLFKNRMKLKPQKHKYQKPHPQIKPGPVNEIPLPWLGDSALLSSVVLDLDCAFGLCTLRVSFGGANV